MKSQFSNIFPCGTSQTWESRREIQDGLLGVFQVYQFEQLILFFRPLLSFMEYRIIRWTGSKTIILNTSTLIIFRFFLNAEIQKDRKYIWKISCRTVVQYFCPYNSKSSGQFPPTCKKKNKSKTLKILFDSHDAVGWPGLSTNPLLNYKLSYCCPVLLLEQKNSSISSNVEPSELIITKQTNNTSNNNTNNKPSDSRT
jgi:hypothetical protein